MKILQIAPLSETVPPQKYGGSERVIHVLTEELVKRGHDVTLFASGDSTTSARKISVYPKSLRKANIIDPYGLNELALSHIGLAYQYQDDFDIIHDHTAPLSVPTANLARTPTLLTMHNQFSINNKFLYNQLENLNLVTISQAQAKRLPFGNIIGTVYNGLNMEQYPVSENPKNYLLFVGRISREKGVHDAIEIAQHLNMQLIIAAKLDQEELPYFNECVRPKLSDDRIKWIGEVDEKERNELMSNAKCLIHPVNWPEPFGLSIIEAMACGCPVVALKKGSIPEIIVQGENGFYGEEIEELVDYVREIDKIDRVFCREYVLKKFNAKQMASGYEVLYKKLLKEQRKSKNSDIQSTRQYVH